MKKTQREAPAALGPQLAQFVSLLIQGLSGVTTKVPEPEDKIRKFLEYPILPQPGQAMDEFRGFQLAATGQMFEALPRGITHGFEN